MASALKGKGGNAKDSWFLPFNQGWNNGAGNPPNPDGLKTDYLWKQILTPARLTDIHEFNQRYASGYTDPERTLARIKGEISQKVLKDTAF